MSKEEMIDIAEKIGNFGWSDYDDFEINKKAIQGLLDLYKQEKEKNKELKDTNKKLYELCQGNAMQEFINNECGFIPKSKVKAKIEELEKRKQDLLQLPDDCARTLGLEDCDEKIILYKELLEEGE